MTYQDNIFFQISRESRLLIRQMNEMLRVKGLADLEASSFFLLCSLLEFPCCGLTELAKNFGMDRTTLSRGFYLLIKKGYARKKDSPDKRFSAFCITAMGERIVSKYLPLINSLHHANMNIGLSDFYAKLKEAKAWKG